MPSLDATIATEDSARDLVTLSCGPWRHEETFVASLRASWEQQYADYLGEAAARALVRSLTRSGALYRHHGPSTVIASLDGRPVGVAATRALGPLSLITMLEVVPAHRGRGIGSRLLRALGERTGGRAARTGTSALVAHVSVHRPRVRALYVAAGFAPLERTVVDHGGYPLEFDVVAKALDGGAAVPDP